MKTFFAVLKNDYLRMLPRWVTVGIFTLFTLATMLFAVYLTEVQHFNAHIAYIPQDSSMSVPQSSPSLTVNVLEEVPPRSALMQQQYDAYVTPGPGGTYTIETLKSQDFKQLLALLLQDPNADLSALQPGRGVGVNILGFMMMFALTLAAFGTNLVLGQVHVGFSAQPVAHSNHLWNLLGMVLAGLAFVLAGGCPGRQLILSGEGDGDAAVFVLGMIAGAAFAHNFALASGPDTMAEGVLKVGGPSVWGMWAVGIGIVVCLLIGWTMREKIEGV